MERETKHDTSMDDEIDLYELYLKLRKRWKIISGIFISAIVIAVIISFSAPPIYRVEMVIKPADSLTEEYSLSASVTSGRMIEPALKDDSLIEEISALLQSKAVWLEVAKEFNLSLTDIDDIDNIISVSEGRRKKVINIAIDYTDPKLAHAMAVSLIEKVEEKVRSIYVERITIERKLLEDRISDINNELDDAIKQIANLENKLDLNLGLDVIKELDTLESLPAVLLSAVLSANGSDMLPQYLEYIRLYIKAVNLQAELDRVLSEYSKVKLKESKYLKDRFIDVLDPPHLLEEPVKPNKKLNIAVAGVSGLFLGIFLALLVEWISERRKEVIH